MEIWTVGHGTSSADDFARILGDAGADVVVDIRRFPGSRRHPHFGSDEMQRWLPEAGIEYQWSEELGGRRRPDPSSPNTGLRNEQFRAYADHMASPEFRGGVHDLLDLAERRQAVVMCSESVWWRCHRRLLADHLVEVRHVAVKHLFHDGRLSDHPVMPEARTTGDRILYLAG